MPDTVTTLICYEDGRDGFWLHRYLHAQGIANLVVDSASIEVSRRSKRAKTDMLDVDKLLLKFRPHELGYDCPLTLQFIGRRRATNVPLIVGKRRLIDWFRDSEGAGATPAIGEWLWSHTVYCGDVSNHISELSA